MSDEETQIIQTEDGQMLTAEYKDGQLQIVEVAAIDKGRYVQVLDSDKGVMNLDLLSLIKSDGNSTFQLVGTSTGEYGDDTVTCVLAKQDNEEIEQDSYVIVNAEEEGRDPLVYLQSTLHQINTQQTHRGNAKQKILFTPEQILEKAKALQKANALRVNLGKSGRKRKREASQSMELLSLISSPGFKLYLYSCKHCSFKCNAIKEMSKHKATEHSGGRGRGGAGRSPGANLQCARCPYRASTHLQLVKHVNETHFSEDDEESTELVLDSDEVSDADVLVCGACGFESSERNTFRRHIESAHGVNVTLTPAIITLEEDTSPPN